MEDFNCKKCDSTNLEFVKYKMINGFYQLRKQCFDCGYLLTHNYKKDYVKNYDELPYVDLEKRKMNALNSGQKRYIKSILFDYAQKHFERSYNYYHNVYLKSDEWKHKRRLIMEYYKYKCQSCGDDATDLHHKTYNNIFKEKFEDLEPLCRKCHNKEHNLNEDNNTNVVNKKEIIQSIKIENTISGLSLKSIRLKREEILKKLNKDV